MIGNKGGWVGEDTYTCAHTDRESEKERDREGVGKEAWMRVQPFVQREK